MYVKVNVVACIHHSGSDVSSGGPCDPPLHYYIHMYMHILVCVAR